jgi:DNA-binding MarR family transcriptional regulator
MEVEYLGIIALVEHLHRQFLQVVKLELESLGVHEINNVQAMMLFNIGDIEMTAGELTLSGCYLGSNVFYNMKKMVETGYITQERSRPYRRTVWVHLTDKGRELRTKIERMHDRHAAAFFDDGANLAELRAICGTLRRLDRFWSRFGELGPRALLSSGILRASVQDANAGRHLV